MVDIGHILSRVQTPLTALVTSSDTDFPVVSTSGFVAPCAVLVGHEDAWHDPTVTYVPEIVWITEVVDGTTLRTTLPDRGISGTAVRDHDGTTGDLTVTAVLDERHWQRLRDEIDGLARIKMGTYTGDGTGSRDIALQFTPGFVVVSGAPDGTQRSFYSGAALGSGIRGIRADSADVLPVVSAASRPELLAAGFRVGGATLNGSGTTYTYTAVGA